MKDEALSIDGVCVERLPVARATGETTEQIERTVEILLAVVSDLREFEQAVLQEAEERLGLPDGDQRLISWLSLPFTVFCDRVARLSGARIKSAKASEDVCAFWHSGRQRQVDILSRQLSLEKALARLVEDAYGLSDEERELIRRTRPIRDPIDFLEASVKSLSDQGATKQE